VQCELEDAQGRKWSIIEKTAIVSKADMDAHSSYPHQGFIGCEILERRRDAEHDVVRITTERSWMVESVDGSTEFDVLADSIVDLD
jgi:hypothetical protein